MGYAYGQDGSGWAPGYGWSHREPHPHSGYSNDDPSEYPGGREDGSHRRAVAGAGYAQSGPLGDGDRSGVFQGEGWSLLVRARPHQALRVFARQAQSRPRHGIPKVGYALASASAGDLARGVWAMRRAFRIDPDSLHYPAAGKRLQAELEALLGRYRRAPGRPSDNAFMSAALNYLLGDSAAAQKAVRRAIGQGDDSESTRNLQSLIAAMSGGSFEATGGLAGN